MTSHAERRAALIRERESRLAAYHHAVAARDAIMPFASAPYAIDFDRAELRRAESRVASARRAICFWNDPLPAADAAPTLTAPAPSAACTAPVVAGAVNTPMSEADRLANEILAAVNGLVTGAAPWVDGLAGEILAAARLAEEEGLAS